MAAKLSNGEERLSAEKTSQAAANGTTNGVHKIDAENEHEESDEDDEDEENGAVKPDGEAAKKKKKKNKKKKKKKATPKAQTSPPRVLISNLFPSGEYPEGEINEYKNENNFRTTSEEKRHLDRAKSDWINDYRKAAEIHRQVRGWARQNMKPGQTLTEIAEGIEDSVRALSGHNGLEEGDNIKGGIGFPTGVNINHVAAHYSPNAGNKWVLQQEDVLKVDFGVHFNGWIVDSAFTHTFDPIYDPLLHAVRDATNAGVREAGIDVRLGDLGAVIQEAMESYELEIGGKTYPIKAIRNLSGHDIVQNCIHGGKSVPLVKSNDTTKMEEGEVFAIETFGSTGKGHVYDDLECSHYALKSDAPHKSLRVSSANTLLGVIKRNWGTLPWCRRYLDRLGQEKYLLGLNSLVREGIVEAYPPLVDQKGSYTAQLEHTIILRPNCKEVVSRGDDY